MVSPALILIAVLLVFLKYLKIAFIAVALCIASSIAALFYTMFPNVLIPSVAENSLTIWNSSSSAYTLEFISIVAVIFVPVILVYQIWSYYIFRKRINPRKAHLEA
jgi:cytochrome d ubiquinol oxidase subunit II